MASIIWVGYYGKWLAMAKQDLLFASRSMTMIDVHDIFPRLSAQLESEDRECWLSFLESEATGDKHRWQQDLNRFIAKLESRSTEYRRNFVTNYCAAMESAGIGLDRHNPIPIRYPLFERIFLPILIEDVSLRKKDSARWLSAFGNALSSKKTCQELQRHDLPEDLLKLALEIDPSDILAKRRIIQDDFWALWHDVYLIPFRGPASAEKQKDELEYYDVLARRTSSLEQFIQESSLENEYGDAIDALSSVLSSRLLMVRREIDTGGGEPE